MALQLSKCLTSPYIAWKVSYVLKKTLQDANKICFDGSGQNMQKILRCLKLPVLVSYPQRYCNFHLKVSSFLISPVQFPCKLIEGNHHVYVKLPPFVFLALYIWVESLITTFKVVLHRSPRSPDIHDLSKCHHLYDLSRHTEHP